MRTFNLGIINHAIHFQQQLLIYVTGPAKRDQVGTKYTILQNDKYLEFYAQYLVSVNCKMLPITLYSDGKNFTSVASGDH